MSDIVRIGNAQAFWGDRTDAASEMLAHEPDLDFLTLDYLAEVSMSLLAMQRERDPRAGYAQDFVDVVRSLIPYWSAGGRCRLIANAGGLNPRGCAEACRKVLEEAGCRSLRIGIVSGDNVIDVVRDAATDSRSQQFQNLDSGGSLHDVRDNIETANAYLGANPIVAALNDGADIVITGRVADPSLVVAACMHHFGWAEDDWGPLAGATVAGHLIECGTQVTGGISTDWLDIPDPVHLGFPIVEVSHDGRCVVTKPRLTGGCVTLRTVREQLVYEIGDPDNYLSPDVAVSLLTLEVEEVGPDRVRVSGATGKPRPETYKVSATVRDGFRAAGQLTIVGRGAAEKARRCGELILQRVREAGFSLRDSVIECVGSGDLSTSLVDAANATRKDHNSLSETFLRVAVHADSRDAVERFSREVMPFITAAAQGTTGYAEGRPRIHPVFRYWPCLIPRAAVTPQTEVIVSAQSDSIAAQNKPRTPYPTVGTDQAQADKTPASHEVIPSSPGRPTTLYDVAHARSGDKGINANVGIIARDATTWPFLQTWLTAERVESFFAPLGVESVQRYELSNLQALNFILRGVLKNSLKTDAQGKTLGQLLLEMPLPDDFVGMIPVSHPQRLSVHGEQ